MIPQILMWNVLNITMWVLRGPCRTCVRTDCGRFWGLPHPCVDGSCRYDPDLTSSLRALGQICQTLPFWSTVFTIIHYDSLVLSAMLVYVGRVWGCINVCIASWGEKKSITLRTASQRLWISQTFLVVWQPSHRKFCIGVSLVRWHACRRLWGVARWQSSTCGHVIHVILCTSIVRWKKSCTLSSKLPSTIEVPDLWNSFKVSLNMALTKLIRR